MRVNPFRMFVQFKTDDQEKRELDLHILALLKNLLNQSKRPIALGPRNAECLMSFPVRFLALHAI